MTPQERYTVAELLFWAERIGSEIGPRLIEKHGDKAKYRLERLHRDLDGLLTVVREEYTDDEKRGFVEFMQRSHFYILPGDDTAEAQSLLEKEKEWLEADLHQ